MQPYFVPPPPPPPRLWSTPAPLANRWLGLRSPLAPPLASLAALLAVPAAGFVRPADVLDFSEDTPGSTVSSAAPRRPPAPPVEGAPVEGASPPGWGHFTGAARGMRVAM